MSSTWINQVRFAEAGEPATAGAVNRAPLGLESRTSFLRRRLDQAEAGQSLVAWDVALSPEALIGQPVYWNASSGRFEPALAAVVVGEGGLLQASPTSVCLGVVYAKDTSTNGSVLLDGYADLDISNAVDGNVDPGFYYLSGVEPGKLVRQPQPVTVCVLFADGGGKVFMQAEARDILSTHTHRRFDLACRPAGDTTQPDQGNRHSITNPDDNKPGWLPASYFGSAAPRNAAFGYNLKYDPTLQAAWPPVPSTGACLVWNRGNGTGGVQVPDGPHGLVQFTSTGIWWMSDCYADVPWPTETVLNSMQSSLPSEQSIDGPECPRWDGMTLTLYFSTPRFATDNTAVLSLVAENGSPIEIVDSRTGRPASSGPLLIKYSSGAILPSSDADGYTVIKGIDSSGRFVTGAVVEGVKSGNDNLTVVGSRSKVIGGSEYQQGLLDLIVNFDPPERDLPFSFVSLNDVKQRPYRDLLYLGFPAAQASSMLLKLRVPSAGLPASPKVKLRTQVLGRTSGTLPDLDVSYRVLPAGTTPTALPLSDSVLGFSSSGAITADYYKQVDSASIPVSGGDTVFVTISRAAGDGYGGEVGLLDFVGVLFAGTP